MIKFKANRVITGDYGTMHPGQVFEVSDVQARELVHLESAGIITRHVEFRRPVFVPTYNTKVNLPSSSALYQTKDRRK